MSNECKCQIPNTDLAGRCFKCGGYINIPASDNPNKTHLPVEVVNEIKKGAQDTLTRASSDLSYSAGYYDGYSFGATAYATKLHEAQQEKEALNAKVANLGACLVLCSDIIPRDIYPELMDSIKKYLKTYKIKDLDGE